MCVCTKTICVAIVLCYDWKIKCMHALKVRILEFKIEIVRGARP